MSETDGYVRPTAAENAAAFLAKVNAADAIARLIEAAKEAVHDARAACIPCKRKTLPEKVTGNTCDTCPTMWIAALQQPLRDLNVWSIEP